MTAQTRSTDHEETFDTLQQLVSILRDSQNDLVDAANHVGDRATLKCFYELAAERAELKNQLKAYLKIHHEVPGRRGSLLSTVRRIWTGIRAVLCHGDARLVLREVEKAEYSLKQGYEQLLEDTAGDPVHELLVEQYDKIRTSHQRIRQLSNQQAATG